MGQTQNNSDDDYLPLSALNHLLFCERRAALIHIEGAYVHNAYTLEGTNAHRRADRLMQTTDEPAGVRVVHAMLLKSERLRLVGKADVVEFVEFKNEERRTVNDQLKSQDGSTLGGGSVPNSSFSIPHPSFACRPYPVEYKRGRRRRWDNDDVQLCAQALCLEEMLGVAVPAGAIFHVKSKRRREIMFTPELRAKTEEAARRLHELVAAGVTPPPVLKPRCRGCSLRELCMPELMGQARRIRDYHGGLFVV